MPEQDSFDTLETRVAQLLDVLEKLSVAHEKLEQSHQNLKIECARLQKKNSVASSQIEDIIKQLKSQSTASASTPHHG